MDGQNEHKKVRQKIFCEDKIKGLLAKAHTTVISIANIGATCSGGSGNALK